MLRILHFLSHRRATLRIWHHGDPAPVLRGQCCLVGNKNIPATLQRCFFGGGGGGGEWGSILTERGLEASILKLDVQRAFFLTFLSKIEGWRRDESTRFTPLWPGFESRRLRHSSFGFMFSLERIFSNSNSMGNFKPRTRLSWMHYH